MQNYVCTLLAKTTDCSFNKHLPRIRTPPISLRTESLLNGNTNHRNAKLLSLSSLFSEIICPSHAAVTMWLCSVQASHKTSNGYLWIRLCTRLTHFTPCARVFTPQKIEWTKQNETQIANFIKNNQKNAVSHKSVVGRISSERRSISTSVGSQYSRTKWEF